MAEVSLPTMVGGIRSCEVSELGRREQVSCLKAQIAGVPGEPSLPYFPGRPRGPVMPDTPRIKKRREGLEQSRITYRDNTISLFTTKYYSFLTEQGQSAPLRHRG